MTDARCSVPDCGFRQHIVVADPPMCDGHYRRLRRHGSVDATKMPTKGLPLLERFLTHTSSDPSGCLLWTSNVAVGPRGVRYGRFKLPTGRNVLAHRWRYQHAHPTLDLTGLVVRHTCDVSLCVHLDHLLHGTQADNISDCIERGRAWWQQA